MADTAAFDFLIERAADKARGLAGEISALETRIRDLEGQALQIDDTIRKGLARGSVTILSPLYSRADFVQRERQRQQSLRRQSADLRSQLSDLRRQLHVHFAEKKRLQVLRNSRLASERLARKKREAAQLDDIAVLRHQKRPLPGGGSGH